MLRKIKLIIKIIKLKKYNLKAVEDSIDRIINSDNYVRIISHCNCRCEIPFDGDIYNDKD